MSKSILLVLLVILTFGVLMPQPMMEILYVQVPIVGQLRSWIKSLWPIVDLEHVMLFAGLGASIKFAYLKVWPLYLMMVLTAFAGLTEIAQFWVPGRTPLINDFLEDVAGAALGLCLLPSHSKTDH